MGRPIHVEIAIRAPLEELWRLTQSPDLHQRWDLRFTRIAYLPRPDPGQPQRFRYETRIGFGLAVSGEGESVGDRDLPDGMSARSGRSGVSETPRAAIDAPIILYDGVCGLCNRLNRFVLARDPAGRFRFAALQSAFAAEILARHGRDPQDLDTLYLVLAHGQPNERLLWKSDAALWILRALGGSWRAAGALRVVPRWARDLGYDLVARTRYRLFGRYDRCPLPDPRHRARFLDHSG